MLALFHAFGLRNFLAASALQSGAFIVAAGVSALMSAWMLYQWVQRDAGGHEKEGESGYRMSLPAAVAAPVVMFMFSYIAFSQTIPHLVTMAVGTADTVRAEVVRDTGGGRYSCGHRIAIDGVDDWLLELCITASTWDQLPDESFTAEFEVQRSLLGISFQRFQTPDADVGSEFAVMNRWWW